jgi:hypothetical protein
LAQVLQFSLVLILLSSFLFDAIKYLFISAFEDILTAALFFLAADLRARQTKIESRGYNLLVDPYPSSSSLFVSAAVFSLLSASFHVIERELLPFAGLFKKKKS